jgi:hypothetical protein
MRVILGLFRETIFLQTRYEFKICDEVFSAELVELEESTRRDEDESRTLVFRILGASEFLSNGNEGDQYPLVNFRFGIDSFLVKAVGQIEKVTASNAGHMLYVDVPKVLEIENARKNRRKKSKSNLGIASVLVRSGSLHTEGVLELNDYSLGGYGAILQVPNGFELVSDTYVSGQLTLGSEALLISCYIKRARLIEEKFGNWDAYSVGLQNATNFNQSSKSESQQTSSQNDRRSNVRISVQEQISLTAAINRDVCFKLQLEEASVTGFSGKLINAAQLVEFPLGSCFKMENPPLSVVLQGFEGDRLRFSIQEGSVNDRLEWFKRVSPYLLKGVSHSVYDARDLLEVFCASGALSTEYLKTQRTHGAEFLSPFETTTRDQFWIHRWIHHNENKEVTGHWCAIRLGDNGWFLADLAGSPEKEKKIPRNFTELFFKSFSDFSMSNKPCPVHMYAWIVGHPYWMDFCELIKSSGLIRELVLTGYSRYSIESLQTDRELCNISKRVIQAAEYKKISDIRSKLVANGSINHASLFDFDIDRFGSPILSDHFKFKQQPFARHYIEMAAGQTRWLAVFTTFPLGASFNRVPESIWVFPLEGGEQENKSVWPALAGELFSTALMLGMKPSSIRRILLPGCTEPYSGELAVMENILVHPSASRLYEGKK